MTKQEIEAKVTKLVNLYKSNRIGIDEYAYLMHKLVKAVIADI